MQTLLFVIRIKHRALLGRVICGVFVGLIALWILPTVVRGFYYGPQSNDWPQVEGTIVDHRVVPIDREGVGNRYGVKLIYQYEVEGQQYTGSQIDVAGTEIVFHGELSQELQIRSEEQYPKGDPIEIFHHPTQPAKAILVRGIVPTTYWQLVFMIFIVAAYIYFLFHGEKRSSSPQAPNAPGV